MSFPGNDTGWLEGNPHSFFLVAKAFIASPKKGVQYFCTTLAVVFRQIFGTSLCQSTQL